MLTVFWDSKGSIIEDYLEKGWTINSARYSQLLTNMLKPAIRTTCKNAEAKQVKHSLHIAQKARDKFLLLTRFQTKEIV